jgi:CRISPR-associated protein Cas5t
MTSGTRAVEALEVTVTAPVASFRDPLYAGVQAGLPCPPPATIAGMLASTAGGWDRVPAGTRFGASFAAAGTGTDLETYHPLDAQGRKTEAVPKNRAFLAGVTLIVWLTEDLDLWEAAVRRPVWPLRLGRSQDLAAATPRRVQLARGPGRQGHAITPAELSGAGGVLLRMATAVSVDRTRTRWNAYRYAAGGSRNELPDGLATADGQAVPLISSVHPAALKAVV